MNTGKIAVSAIVCLGTLISSREPPAWGHQPFPAYAEHRILININKRYMDIAVELVLFHGAALDERSRVDADGDGIIVPAETRARLEAISRQPAAPEVRWNGKPLAAAELYDPELDLLNDNRAAPSPLAVRRHSFCRTPADWTGAARVEIGVPWLEDLPAVCHWRAQAADGIVARNASPASLVSEDPSLVPRVFSFELVPPGGAGPPASAGDALQIYWLGSFLAMLELFL